MAWRFQPSKFKNTTPKPPKKEATIFDLPIGNLSCTNNGIQASEKYLAFHIDGEGGKLGVVPLTARGRRLRTDIGVVCAHGDQVDDFNFLPFNSDILISCSRDDRLKLWKLSGDEVVSASLRSEIDVGHGVVLECLKPHSTASNIVGVASSETAYVVDVESNKVALEVFGITEKAQSLDWSPDGKLLAISTDKGRQVSIYDPRAGSDPIQNISVHQGLGREGRVLFCGDRLLSSGFTNKRVQEVRLLDTGKWNTVHTQEFVSTTGVLIPHYDPDTKLLYLTGKGTNKMFMLEQQDRAPLLSHVFELTLAEQSLGACLGSKRSVTVMNGEVGIFYQLTKSSIVPVPCIVPRRTYREFHADLFPDTVGPIAGCSSSEWFSGSNTQPAKISLAPGTVSNPSPPPQEPTPPLVNRGSQHAVTASAKASVKAEVEEPSPPSMNTAPAKHPTTESPNSYLKREIADLVATTPPVHAKQENGTVKPHAEDCQKIVSPVPAPTPSPRPTSTSEANSNRETSDGSVRMRSSGEGCSRRIVARVRPKSCVVGTVASKFRHVETVVGIKANNAIISNMRNVNTRLPPECNGTCVSGEFVAVPLTGPAGLIGIYDVDVHDKIPAGVMDGICNKAQVTDLEWNPFNDFELAVGTDCGIVNLWRLSKEDGPRLEMEPYKVIKIGGEKILNIRWHPLAANLMALGLSDGSIELWDTESASRLQRITVHEGSILAISWSADGRSLVSLGKDAMLVVSQPQFPDFMRKIKVLENVRAARTLFVCEDRAIIVVSFTRGSGRQVQLYDSDTLRLIWTQAIDNATQPLVPHYDYDSSVLFLCGKGDRIVHMYEICYDSPYFLQLLSYQGSSGSQAIAYHNKKKCDVMAVEFQRAWRLTDKSLEAMVFRVPRVKKDVFQADLFPDALVTWKPVMTAQEWINGDDRPPRFESLKPEGVFSTGVPASTRRAVAANGDTVTVNSASRVPSNATHTPVTTTATTTANTTTTDHDGFSITTPRARASVSDSAMLTALGHKGDIEVIAPTKDLPGADLIKTEKKLDNKSVAASISSRLTTDLVLEQDKMEGVDEEEWHL